MLGKQIISATGDKQGLSKSNTEKLLTPPGISHV